MCSGPMRLGRSALLVGLLSLLWATGAAHAKPRVLVKPDKFRPTQEYVGKALVEQLVDEWRQDAASRKQTLKKYAKDVLVPEFAKLKIPTVLDPSGKIRNTDGHHRISALIEVEKETGVEIPIGTKVVADYTGKSEKKFAKSFIKRWGGDQFSPAVKDESAVKQMASLPKTFTGLRNDPMRSVVGEAFRLNGLEGVKFEDFVEFKLARQLEKRGLIGDLREAGVLDSKQRKVPANLVFDAGLQKVVTEELTKKSTRKFLLDQAAGHSAEKKLKKRLKEIN